MEIWVLGLFLKPLLGFVFLLLIWLIASVLHRVIPDGKVKRVLYSPLPGHRKR